MDDDAAGDHGEVERDPGRSGVEPELPRRVDHQARRRERVEEPVELQLAGRGHEERVAGLGEDEVKGAAAHVSAHLEDPAPEKAHEEALDQHRGPDQEQHLVLAPAGDRRGVLVYDRDHQDVDRDPEQLDRATRPGGRRGTSLCARANSARRRARCAGSVRGCPSPGDSSARRRVVAQPPPPQRLGEAEQDDGPAGLDGRARWSAAASPIRPVRIAAGKYIW